MEARFFSALNAIMVPKVRKGWGPPAPAPGRLIVLETTGRRSGRRYSVPLAAVKLRGHILVGTFRGRRSQWIHNVAAEPNVRYWLNGREKKGKATVLKAGRGSAVKEGFPSELRWLVPALAAYMHAGWSFAVLSPEPVARGKRATATRRAAASRKRAV